MNGGEVFVTIIINSLIIYFLHVLHKRSIAKTVQHLRKEVEELENLVAAIIEEFEEVANKVLQNSAETSNDDSKKFPADHGIELTQVTPEKTLHEILELNEEGPPETLPIFQPHEIIDSKHQQILQLWNDGMAVEEIAKKLGTGRGEVQLILGIYKRS